MKTLDEIAIENGTDQATVFTRIAGGVAHGYTPHFERFFEPLRFEPLKVLEIGVGGGESVRTWLEYFPKARVFGIDIIQGTNPWNTSTYAADPRYTFQQGDQADPAFWENFARIFGGAWDIIIDDGGHERYQIEATFRAMWRHINYGGLYCIEDLGYCKSWDLVKEQIDRSNSNTEVSFVYCFNELAIIGKKPIPR